MVRWWGLAAWMAAIVSCAGAAAAACGGTYQVVRGDTLSAIAEAQYGDAGTWTAIYSANAGTIGESPDLLFAGITLRLPCIGGRPVAPVVAEATTDPAPLTSRAAPAPASAPILPAPLPQEAPPAAPLTIRFVTAGDFAPFTDPALLNGGLITDVVDQAMAASPVAHEIFWVNDWSAHLDPLLSQTMMDAGFPWAQPDCAGTPQAQRCTDFHFSTPIFENLILLFALRDSAMVFDSDADMAGRSLCRPAGYFTHDLEKDGRRWLSEGRITLARPQTVAECFRLLREGGVDAVAINEFTGRSALSDLGWQEQIAPLPRPLSIEGLHVLVHKDHPQAEAVLEAIDGGLAALKTSGDYQRIIETHLTRIWAGF